MNACPLCRLPMRLAGRYIEARDDAGLFVVFPVCMRCRLRLDRLPLKLQARQQMIAFRRLAENPDRYEFKAFASQVEARLYRVLAAEAGA